MAWFSGKCFPKKFGGKHFPEVVKNLEMSLFADYIKFDPQTFDHYIYFIFNIYFQFHLLKFYFYINFGPYFYNCYLLFSYHFFIENFYLSDLVLIFLIVTYFIWNNLWNVDYYYFNFFIFYFIYFLDLISITLIIIYFIWEFMKLYFFFNFILIQLFNL